MKSRIAVIGAGSWGTALASVFSREDNNIFLWGRDIQTIRDIQTHQENKKYLPGIKLPLNIEATTDIQAIKEAEIYVISTPAQYVREILLKLQDILSQEEKSIILTSKGIEEGTGLLMTDIVTEIFPHKRKKTVVLSGPSYAHEVALGLPTALTLAGIDILFLEKLQVYLSRPFFRLYRSLDPIGVQLGGALKNVLAIAAGIVMGRNLGENARAALVTRGLSEMGRLGKVLGAHPETFYGLSGLGDLLLTSMSVTSRNTSFGVELGQGKTKEEILKTRTSVTEGVFTADSLHLVAKKWNVEMPIMTAVFQILQGTQSVEEVSDILLNRPLKEEREAVEI